MKYTCPSCGAPLIADRTSVTLSCPYCGNNLLAGAAITEERMPEYIIPFGISSEQAADSIRSFIKGKAYLPRTFPKDVSEAYPLYVPYYMYDFSMQGHGKYLSIHMVSEEVRATKAYACYGGVLFASAVSGCAGDIFECSGNAEIGNIIVDASAKMPDDYMRSIAPFPFEEAEEFTASRIIGVYTEAVDENSDACRKEAVRIASEELNDRLTADVLESNRDFVYVDANRQFKYDIVESRENLILLPVWVVPIKWNGSAYLIVVNGTSGKCACNLPISKTRRSAFQAIAIAACAVVLALAFLPASDSSSAASDPLIAMFIAILIGGPMIAIGSFGYRRL